MSIPKPPWYDRLNKELGGSEWLINAILIVIIIISVYMLLSKNHVARVTWAVYLLSP